MSEKEQWRRTTPHCTIRMEYIIKCWQDVVNVDKIVILAGVLLGGDAFIN